MGASEPALVVQQDGALLLAMRSPAARSVADGLRRFAQLEKCPGDYHHYRLTDRGLWNAAAAGVTAERVVDFLARASGEAVPETVERRIARAFARYGCLRLVRDEDDAESLWLQAADADLLAGLAARLELGVAPEGRGLPLPPELRGWVKQRLAQLGYPVDDQVGYAAGERLAIGWRSGVALRPYQREAVAAFRGSDDGRGGSGLVVLPCGAGKTLVGIGAAVALGCRTLVLCPSGTAVRQWIEAFRRFTDLPDEAFGEYGPGARRRAIAPVTVTTYQLLTARRASRSVSGGPAPAFPHLARVMNQDWGLIVFDEAQHLPADIFRLTADVQSRRRLGLTATPVREDGREIDLLALIGPTVYTAPWSRLEAEGWIAPVECVEVRVPAAWHAAPPGAARDLDHRQAAAIHTKWPVVRALVRRHRGEPLLVIGQYLDQLHDLAARLGAPVITGRTPRAERERLFDRFRAGSEPVLVLSRVGNAAVDLPDAAVAIEVSGNFGSRQEEAQRLGRVLRPKGGRPAHFYALVTEGSVERDYAARRQRFLVEQGYRYRIAPAAALFRDDRAAVYPPRAEHGVGGRAADC